jgi:uncharacterized phage protein (TIGR01671 family)
MNRPIKFRVWDKITNQYLQELGIYYWHIPYSLDGEEIIGEANLVGLSELLRHDNFVVQQYTGLTDNNDKEIYEGDILIYKTGSIPTTGVIGQVLYEADEGGYIFQWERKGPNQHHINLNCDVAFESVIVGNIFEHSELLK